MYSALHIDLYSYIHTVISLECGALFEEFNGCSILVYNKEKILQCIHYIQDTLMVECNLKTYI